MRALLTPLLAVAAFSLPLPALAQGYPSKPVRIVVPYAAGGGVDTIARVLANKYSDMWKQPVVVENRGGSGGVVGADSVAKSAPDGYTFLYATNAQAIIPSIYRKLPFDPKELTPAALVISSQLVLLASPKVGVNSVKEFVSMARAQPGKLNYGSSGAGGPIHLAMEMLKVGAGIDLVHIPYKGDAQTVPALISGEIHVTFTPMVSALTHVRAGRLRPIAVSGPQRAASLPDIPTLVESGWDVAIKSWTGFFAPAGSPQEAIARLAADTQRVLRMQDMVETLKKTGQDAEGSTPEQFQAYYREEVARYAKVIQTARVPLVD
jgi:tripartite-type tricarboxylate transporter receptor subunit TctC